MLKSILMQMREIKLLLGLNKAVLSLDEFCAYAGISKHYAYQLTSNGKIKFYRPFGKMIYFKLDEVVEFLTSNPRNDGKEISLKSDKYLLNSLNRKK